MHRAPRTTGTGLWGGESTSWENFGGPYYTSTLYGAGAGGRARVGRSGIIFADTDAIFFGAFEPVYGDCVPRRNANE